MNPYKEHYPIIYVTENWTGTILDVLRLPNVATTKRLGIAYRVLDDRLLRLFAVNCARRALSSIGRPDPRSIAACDVAEKYALGLATVAELADAATAANAASADAAYAAAYAAYSSAAHAYDTAYAANVSAAYAAYAIASADSPIPSVVNSDTFVKRKEERNKQIEELIKLIQQYADTSTTFPKEI
jgi:hypothetical protein